MAVIQAVDLTKKYGDFIANDHINLSIEQGEITAIVGENGAGKTTLMNMFYGLQRPTGGELYIREKQVNFNSPLDAINQGLGMVHQHFKLVPSLTVFENIMLGVEINKKIKLAKNVRVNSPIINVRSEKDEVQKIIDA